MAFGITPYKQTIIPLGGYDPDHYLTLLYNAMLGLGWHISYFNHDGLIAYTNISFESYSEEVSVRVTENWAVIKSECVGYQGFLTDYGKNAKNLRLLFNELEYTDAILSSNLQERTKELMDSIPENQFINLAEPPMVGKEKLHDFFNIIVPQRYYFITPILVAVNVAVYILMSFFMVVLAMIMEKSGKFDIHQNPFEKLYLNLGFSARSSVLHGQVWRLVTNTFLHFSPLHLIGNMIALIYIGSMIESKLGKWNFLLLYLLTGICASTASVSWHYYGVSGGASGAIYGLFGILLALASTPFYEHNARRAILISTAVMLAITIAPWRNGIDHAAHFGGLISGYIFGWIFYLGIANKYRFSIKWSTWLVAIITLVFVSSSMVIIPDYKIKDYQILVEKVKVTEDNVKRCFYIQYGKSKEEMLDTIEQRGLPLLKELRSENKQVKAFILPSKLKKEADFHSRVIDLECRSMELYYKGIKEQHYDKYQPAIDSIKNVIYNLNADFVAEQ
ncbi:rhomboid family intramembrane serine protease [Mucilaginibacter sp. HMF5004]|uniref:rhomboid family intramembrane serine protease n=1 Tax=Mucilaginibacter rivuli TaxID=2857527 RepID=UPI001C601ED2|nr:rhomboid family intramembrane serine protease [Mucilaginibacter rivuli]MBW4890541.1 rhomboid family intramembrane serine protease [Mucilaginibacter rivuli]